MRKNARMFSNRLAEACDQLDGVPEDRGRQSWLRRELEGLGEEVTAQGVSNWFSGGAIPRPAMLSKISKVLRVSEAWLLGYSDQAEAAYQAAPVVEHRATVRGSPADQITPIRIRPDLTITVHGLPFDLTEGEARRVANVIMALAS